MRDRALGALARAPARRMTMLGSIETPRKLVPNRVDRKFWMPTATAFRLAGSD